MQRHRSLDLIRGLAAVGIGIYHWLAWNAGFALQSLGTFGVYLFFILSALTMAMVYTPSFSAGIGFDSAASFFRNRAARLLPLLAAVAAASLVLTVVAGGAADAELAKAMLTATGLFGLALPGMLSNATGAWSLGIELIFYAMVPVAVLILSRASRMAAVTALVVLLAAQQLYLFSIAPIAGGLHWDYYAVPLTFAPFFMIGFLLFKLGGARSPAFLPPMLGGFLAIAGFSLLWSGDILRSPAAYLLLTAMCGATVYCANRTRLPQALERPAEFLGDISYAMYLTHPLVNVVVGKAMGLLGIAAVLRFPIFFIAALLVSYAVFRWFEAPMRDRFRHRSGQRPAAVRREHWSVSGVLSRTARRGFRLIGPSAQKLSMIWYGAGHGDSPRDHARRPTPASLAK